MNQTTNIRNQSPLNETRSGNSVDLFNQSRAPKESPIPFSVVQTQSYC